MTPQELIQMWDQHVALGLGDTHMILKMRRTSKRRINSNRVRTPFGMCRWHRHSEDELVIYVHPEQIKKYIAKHWVDVGPGYQEKLPNE